MGGVVVGVERGALGLRAGWDECVLEGGAGCVPPAPTLPHAMPHTPPSTPTRPPLQIPAGCFLHSLWP